uniref:response regulator transcription factor n=1 Tax=Candidatus Wunengus sp. YC60 TaxID=3367697 RepID=UPI0040270DE4
MAFVFYQTKPNGSVKELYYNEVALSIISFSLNSRGNVEVSSDIATLCLRWKKLFDKKLNKSNRKGNGVLPSADFIDILQSHKRRYAVRGLVMSSKEAKEKQYLFLLERISNDNGNLQKSLRQWKLSPREQEIVHLLIEDRCNKEIARTLKLSLNTVKAYMKLLMLKLGVTSRTGVIGRLLTGTNNNHPLD